MNDGGRATPAGRSLIGAAATFVLAAHGMAEPVEGGPTALTLLCHVAVAGYRISTPDGRTVLNGDSPPMPPGESARVTVERATGTVHITGGSLPHTDAAPGRAAFDGGVIGFTWGDVGYSIDPPDQGGSSVLHFSATTELRGGPHDGATMHSFGVGGCTRAETP